MILRRLRDRLDVWLSKGDRDDGVVPSSRVDPKAGPPARPCIVWFDGEPDAPYRLRRFLRHAGVVAATSDARTAARLAILTPRVVHAPSRRAALAGARAMLAKPAPAAPPPPPAPAGRQRVVLQVGDFTEGGMEQVVIDLTEALAAAGMHSSILVLGRVGPAAERARQRGLHLERLAADRDRYAAFLERERVDLINAHFSTFGADLCAAARVPFVQAIHNMYMWFGRPERDEYRAADPYTRAYVCVSNNAARYADLALGLSRERMLVIPNGCARSYVQPAPAPEAVAALRAEFGMPADARIFLNVASIQPAKGQHLLLAAFARVAADCPNAHLLFAGRPMDDAYAETLVQRVRDLGLTDRVHWAGHRSDVTTLHAAAAALVMPSFFEGWSLAITEAVLAGLPVIATDVGGASEQLEGTDGILLSPAAADLSAVDIHRLLALLDSPCEALVDELADALRAVYARRGARSRLPADWERLLRERAYERYVHLFRWLLAGGEPAAARAWTEPGPS